MNVSINGREHTLDIAPEVPLLWVIRDHLNLTGTKFGCGKGLSGAIGNADYGSQNTGGSGN